MCRIYGGKADDRRWSGPSGRGSLVAGATLGGLMSKSLIIAEKPSVGRDLVRVLPGAFTKGEGFLEGPDHVVTWAVGHLVQLADPDEYDDRFKKWRMADLPIVPEHFKLVVRDERSKKQMNVVKRQLGRDDVENVVNACDAIHAHDVGLRRKAIAHPGNVFHVDRGIANCLDRNPVQIRDRLGCGIRNVDVVFLAADLGCAGWQNQVLSGDRIHYIQRGQAPRL